MTWTDAQVLAEIEAAVDRGGAVAFSSLLRAIGCQCGRPSPVEISRVLQRELAEGRLSRDPATGLVWRQARPEVSA